MKILLITVRSDFGGGPRHVDQLIRGLANKYEIYAAYPKDGDPYSKEWDKIIPASNRIYIPYRKFSIPSLLKLKKFIKENKIDIIHSHGNGAGFYTRVLKILRIKAKVVHTFHGIPKSNSNKIKYFINIFVNFIFHFFTDRFISVSHGEYKLAKKHHFLTERKSKVIFNGIDPINKLAKSDNFKVITIARFVYPKNMDFAFEIAEKLKNDNIEFIWVGDGDDWERLKKQAEMKNLKINFVGFSDHPIDYLLTSTVYLSTSRFEGLPYALIEAASVGMPIVATDVVGNNEVVQNNINGFLFNTADEACNYLKQLSSDSILYEKMSKESLNMFNNNFTTAKMLDSLCELYQSL